MTINEADTPAQQQSSRHPPTRRRTVFGRPAEDDCGWRTRGSCTEHDPELWFSPLPAQRIEAVTICEGCPVRGQCLSWARETDQRFGIWGDFEVDAAPDADNGVVDEAQALAATVARLPLVDRVRRLFDEFPGSVMAEVADRLGYSSAGSLERALYRRGDDGKALIRVLKPGSRSREQVKAEKVTLKGLATDRDHPWIVEPALPVNEAGTNVQYRKTGKPGRKVKDPTSSTESKENAA